MTELFALALTLLIHEAGHIAASFICGAPIYGVRSRVGGITLLCRADALSYPRAAAVYAGGAAANLLCAALSFRSPTFASFSIGAAVFNLLPLPGSDGENLLAALFSCASDDPHTVSLIVRAVSDACVFILWAAAVYLSLTGRGGGALLVFSVMLVVYRLGTGMADKRADRF